MREGGRWRPDAWLATRYFVAPSLLGFGLLAVGPPALASALRRALLPRDREPASFLVAAPASYPVALAIAAALWGLAVARARLAAWLDLVRDEVYLVGERLHNYGERRLRRAARSAKGKERVLRPERQTAPAFGNGGLEEADGVDVWAP